MGVEFNSQEESDQEMMGVISQYDDGKVDDGSGSSDFGAPPPEEQGQQKPPAPSNPAQQDAGEGGGEDLTESLNSLAETYHVSPSDLEGFESVEAAEEALRSYYSREAELGASYARSQQQLPPTQPTGADAQFQPPSSQQPPRQDQQSQFAPPPNFEEALQDLEPDHPLRAAFQQQQQYLSQLHNQVTAMNQQQAEAQRQAREAELHMYQQQIDAEIYRLSPERYGTPDKANMFQVQRQNLVQQKAEDLMWSYAARGRQAPPVSQLLADADRMLFYKEIEMERLRNRESARQSQDGARLGRPSAAAPPQSVNDDVPFEENPDLIRYYFELEQQGA